MKKLAIGAVAALLVATSANAADIDFSNVALGSYAGGITVGQYRFNATGSQTPIVFETNSGERAFGDAGGNAFGTILTLERLDGRAFDITNVIFGLGGGTFGNRIDLGASRTAITVDGQAYTGGPIQGVASFYIDAFGGDGSVGFQSLTASVPEPTTWATMMLGFGVIGFAARRRKARVAHA